MKEAIIITSFFWFYNQTVYITDKYLFKEMVIYDTSFGLKKPCPIKDTIYEIYDLENNFIHRIGNDERERFSNHVDTLNKYKVPEAVKFIGVLLNSSIYNGEFEDLDCMIKKGTYEFRERLDYSAYTYDRYQYFASIPLLDSIINTSNKLEFAGFNASLNDEFKFLVYAYSSKSHFTNTVHTTFSTGFLDTTLIHNLLKLPKGKEFYGSNGN